MKNSMPALMLSNSNANMIVATVILILGKFISVWLVKPLVSTLRTRNNEVTTKRRIQFSFIKSFYASFNHDIKIKNRINVNSYFDLLKRDSFSRPRNIRLRALTDIPLDTNVLTFKKTITYMKKTRRKMNK